MANIERLQLKVTGCGETGTPMISRLSWLTAEKNNWKSRFYLVIYNPGLYSGMLQKAFLNHQLCLHSDALAGWAANQS